MNLLSKRPRSDKFSRRIRATAGVCHHKQLQSPGCQKTTTLLIMHLRNIECRLEGF